MLKRHTLICRWRRAFNAFVFACILCLANTSSVTAKDGSPSRILSFDLCVDQLLLDIVPARQIAAVTFLAGDENYSVNADKAKTLPTTRGTVEDAFKYNADLVLVGAFEKHTKIDLLRRLGFKVAVIPLAVEPEFLKLSIAMIGEVTGHQKRAGDVIANFERELTQLNQNISGVSETKAPRGIHLAARRHTQGGNSVVNTLFQLSGFKNMALETGHAEGGYIGLEKLIRSRPDVLLFSKDSEGAVSMATDALKHPAMTYLAKQARHIDIHQKYLLCLTPHITKAARDLQKLHKEVGP